MSKDISLGNRSAVTNRFNFVKDPITGDVSFDETQAHAVMNCSFAKRGLYWADQNHGSRLYTLRSLGFATPSQAEAMELEALEPLQRDRLINPPSVQASDDISTGIGILSIDVDYSTPRGPGSSQVIKV